MATITGDQSANVSGTKSIDSRCIVEFRPDDNWKGEYGFDWFRRGDTVENINGSNSKSNYKPIVGEYVPHDPDYGDDGTLQVDNPGGKPEKSYYAYRLAREEYPVFKIKGIERIYIAPYISLFFASTKQGENCRSGLESSRAPSRYSPPTTFSPSPYRDLRGMPELPCPKTWRFSGWTTTDCSAHAPRRRFRASTQMHSASASLPHECLQPC